LPFINPNDPAANSNQRIPPLSLPGTYPYVEMSQYRDGSWDRRDVTPNNEGFAHGHISGTYVEHASDGSGRQLIANNFHHYTTGGHTETVDKNQHNKIGGSVADHVSQDHYTEHGGDKMHVIGGEGIETFNGINYSHSTGGHQYSSAGDHVSDFNDGNHHHNVAGDSVKYIGGTKYEYIGEEKGTYLPKGNYDIRLDSGNFQLSTGSNITIKSSTSITLQVGSQSIVISPSGITINGSAINMNQV